MANDRIQECHGDWLAVQHGTVLAQDLKKRFQVNPGVYIVYFGPSLGPKFEIHYFPHTDAT